MSDRGQSVGLQDRIVSVIIWRRGSKMPTEIAMKWSSKVPSEMSDQYSLEVNSNS